MIRARNEPLVAWSVMEPVLHRLSAWHPLSQDETRLLLECAPDRRRARAGDELDAGGPVLLLNGWVARQRVMADGRRQILRLLTPGDMIGRPGEADHPETMIVALTDITFVDAGRLISAVRDGSAPGVALALAQAEREHARGLSDTIVRLGAMSAHERTVHLLLELAGRLAAAGIGDGRRFPLPLTQEILSVTLGLSIVHTNRVLQQLRREQMIELRSGVAVLLRPDALAAIARGEAHTGAARTDGPRSAVVRSASRAHHA